MAENTKKRFEGREHPVTKAGGLWRVEDKEETDNIKDRIQQSTRVIVEDDGEQQETFASFDEALYGIFEDTEVSEDDGIGAGENNPQKGEAKEDIITLTEEMQTPAQEYRSAFPKNNAENIQEKTSSQVASQEKPISPKEQEKDPLVLAEEAERVRNEQRKNSVQEEPRKPAKQKKVKEKSRNCTLGDLEFMTDVEAALYRRGHPFAYILSLSIIIVFLVFLVWAKFAIVDQVTRGTGQVIPSQRTQEIQNLEGGILEKVYVQDGEIVKKGQLLLTINNQSAESYYKDQLSKYYENLGAVARLKALLNGTEPVYPDELKEKAPNVIAGQNNILETEKAKFESEVIVLENQYKQRVQEEKEAASSVRRLTQSLRLAKEQRAIAKPLLDKGIYSRVEYLALEQKVVDLEGQLSAAEISLTRLNSSISEAKQRISLRKAELRTQMLDELSKREAELVSAREAIATGGDRVARLEIRAPIQATVKRILIRTAGGVIKPGETIMELVPLDDTLLVEARISPKDRAFIHPGLTAMVKISSFDYAIYGGLEATVEQISADTLEDKRGEFYYQVILRTKKNVIEARGEVHPIIPGMTATVDILTGKRSVLDYLLKPILRARSNALSER